MVIDSPSFSNKAIIFFFILSSRVILLLLIAGSRSSRVAPLINFRFARYVCNNVIQITFTDATNFTFAGIDPVLDFKCFMQNFFF